MSLVERSVSPSSPVHSPLQRGSPSPLQRGSPSPLQDGSPTAGPVSLSPPPPTSVPNQRLEQETEPECVESMKPELSSISCQATAQMLDAFCQTVEYLNKSVTTLDVGVQTIESNWEQHSKVKDNVESFEDMEMAEDVEDIDQDEDVYEESEGETNIKVESLLTYAYQNKSGDDEFPCKLCKKIFVNPFGVKTHIFVAHQKYLTSDNNSGKSESVGGVKRTATTKRRKKLTMNKKKWCNYCWIRFNSKAQYEGHRRAVHPEMIGTRASNTAAADVPNAELKDSNELTTTSGEISNDNVDSPANINEDVEDVEVYLEPEQRKELTAECLDNNKTADVKLIKVDEALELEEDDRMAVTGDEDRDIGDDNTDSLDNSVAEFYTSLPWFESRFHLCLMCEKFSPLGNFSSHVVEVHGISMLLYRERYPSDDFSTKTWSCKMCDKCVKWTQPSISRHLRISHDISLQDYKLKVLNDENEVTKQVVSDASVPWFECTRHRCRICNVSLLLTQLSQHLSCEHGSNAESYRLLFPKLNFEWQNSGQSQWRCMICSKKIFWNKANIQQHLVEHKMSLEEYESKYVEEMKAVEMGAVIDSAVLCKTTNIRKILPTKTVNLPAQIKREILCVDSADDHVQVEKDEELEDQSMDMDTMESYLDLEMNLDEGGSLDGEEEGPSNLEDVEEGVINLGEDQQDARNLANSRMVKLEAREEMTMKNHMVKVGQHEKLWVPWYESKLHTCAICGEMRTCGLSFKNHIYDKHQFLSRRDYVKRFPTADIEPTQWSCNLCTNTVKWTKKCIMDHLKSAHSMSKEEYEIMFKVPPRHQVKAPSGGEYNFNSRTDIGLANKDGVFTTGESEVSESAATSQNTSWDSSLTCGICKEPAINITSHINSYHKMTKAAYLKICPGDQYKFVVKKVWKCRVCELGFVNNKTVIKDHLESQHALDIEDYAKTFNLVDDEDGDLVDTETQHEDSGVVEPSIEDTKYKMLMRGNENPWYENIKITCKECDNQFWLGQFMKHIILNHKMPIKVYRSKHPDTAIPKKSYTCRICGIGISHYASPISGHLTGRHNMTMNDYYEKYEKLNISPPHEANVNQEKPLVRSASSTLSNIAACKITNSNTPITMNRLGAALKGMNPTSILAASNTNNTHMDSPNIKNQRQAEFAKTGKVPWYECKTTICKFCNEEWLLGSFRRHLYDRHDKMSRTLYMEMYPDADISLPTWNCKICGNGVRWVRDNIFYHLRTHNFTMEGYRQLYIENSDVIDQNSAANKPMPNLVPIANGNGTKEKKFRCKLCNVLVAFESNAIKLHLKNYHNLSIDEYQPLARAKAGSQLKAGTGHASKPSGSGQHFMTGLLNSRDNDSPTLLEKMLTASKASKLTTENKEATLAAASSTASAVPVKTSPCLPWYNRCKWTCMICRRAFSSGFWKHVQESHEKSKEDYLSEHGKAGIDIVHYFCKICNKKIPWSGASINSHTKSEHNMSLKEYEVEHAPSTNQTKIKTEIKKETEVESNRIDDRADVDEAGGVGENVNLPELQSLVTESNYIHSPHHWFNGCEYKCQVCSTVLHSVAGLSMHLKDIHALDKFTYFREHGRSGINIRKYRCKICLKEFPWSGVSISKHVKQAHLLSLERYTNVYEAASTVDSLSKEMYDSSSTTDIKEEVEDVTGLLEDGLSTQDDAIVVDPIIVTPTMISSPLSVYTPTIKERGPKWYNKCSWTCQICGETTTTNSSAFYKHVVQDHGINIDDYKEEYGNTGFVYVDHTCKLCHKKVPFNGLSMCKHLKHSHAMQLEEYEARHMKDDDGTSTGDYYAPTDEHWYNKCLWKCLICGNKNKSLGSSKKHIQKGHNMTYDSYISDYGKSGITEVQFTCNICTANMSCNGVTIASHLLNNHKLTLNDYERDYLNTSGSSGQGQGHGQGQGKGFIDPSEASNSLGIIDAEHFLAGGSSSTDQWQGASNALTREEIAARRERPWYQKCQYFCQICNQSYFSISALRNHSKVKHNMDRDTYVSLYGIDAGKVIEDYNCKICQRRVKCEGRSLNSHMRNCHKMGILEYSKRYETEKHYNGDQDQDQEHDQDQDQDQDDPNFYSEAYEIEMDNCENENEQGLMEYQEGSDEEIYDDSQDPLSNYVTAELNDEGDDTNNDNELNQEESGSVEVKEGGDEDITEKGEAAASHNNAREEAEADMTTEESQHFNFSVEDDEEIQVENVSLEDDMEIKPDITDLTMNNEDQSQDTIIRETADEETEQD